MRVLILLIASLLMAGCAVGRGPMGEIVIGVDAGRLPETASEIGGAAVSAVFGPQAGTIVSTVLASVLGAGSIGVAGANMRGKEKARKLADQGREKAEKEAIALRMLIQSLRGNPQKEEPVEPPA